ncbi:MAG: alpha/beta hydrolase [bacterium]|nr:alpha/beta hydrolase [bacterium]
MFILIDLAFAASVITKDGFLIDYEIKESKSNIYIVLLHGLQASKDEWYMHPEGVGFTKIIEEMEFGYVAIDLRGHGKSKIKNKKIISVEELNAQDFISMKDDVLNVLESIKEKNKNAIFILTGASLGANVAINSAKNKDVIGVILLSPGFSYAGIPIIPAYIEVEKPILLASGMNDTYSYRTVKDLEKLGKKTKPLVIISDTNYHGVVLFNDKRVINEVKNFIIKISKRR